MKKVIIICTVILISCNILQAQTNERPFALGVFGGLTQYNGDLGNGFYDMSQNQYGHIGLNAAWYITPHFDFTMNAGYGSIGYTENSVKNFHGEQIQWNGHFNF